MLSPSPLPHIDSACSCAMQPSRRAQLTFLCYSTLLRSSVGFLATCISAAPMYPNHLRTWFKWKCISLMFGASCSAKPSFQNIFASIHGKVPRFYSINYKMFFAHSFAFDWHMLSIYEIISSISCWAYGSPRCGRQVAGEWEKHNMYCFLWRYQKSTRASREVARGNGFISFQPVEHK